MTNLQCRFILFVVYFFISTNYLTYIHLNMCVCQSSHVFFYLLCMRSMFAYLLLLLLLLLMIVHARMFIYTYIFCFLFFSFMEISHHHHRRSTLYSKCHPAQISNRLKIFFVFVSLMTDVKTINWQRCFFFCFIFKSLVCVSNTCYLKLSLINRQQTKRHIFYYLYSHYRKELFSLWSGVHICIGLVNYFLTKTNNWFCMILFFCTISSSFDCIFFLHCIFSHTRSLLFNQLIDLIKPLIYLFFVPTLVFEHKRMQRGKTKTNCLLFIYRSIEKMLRFSKRIIFFLSLALFVVNVVLIFFSLLSLFLYACSQQIHWTS